MEILYTILNFQIYRNTLNVLPLSPGLYILPNLKYLPKYFAQIYRAQYGAAMLVYLQGTPTSRPEKLCKHQELSLTI